MVRVSGGIRRDDPRPGAERDGGAGVRGDARERAVNRAVLPLLAQYLLSFTSYLSLTPVLAVLIRDGWHQSAAVVGLALFVFSCSSRAGSILLSPRLEGLPGVRVLIVANLLSGTSFLVMSQATSPVPLIALLALAGTGVSLNGLVVRSVIAEWTSGTRSQVTAFAKLNALLNVAAAVGPIIGTTLLSTRSPWRLPLVLAAGYYAAAAIMFTLTRRADRAFDPGGKRFSFRSYGAALRRSVSLRHLMLASTSGWLLYAQLYSALPIHLFATTHSKVQVAALFSMAAVLIVVLQIPVSKAVGTLLERGTQLSTVLFTGLGCFATSFAIIALAGGRTALLYAAVAVFTLGEVLFAPSVDTAFATAGRESAAGFIAVYTGKQITLAVGESTGAFIGGALFSYVQQHFSPGVYWWGCSAIGVLAVLALSALRLRTSPAPAPDAHRPAAQPSGDR